jgi:hypothetical protein
LSQKAVWKIFQQGSTVFSTSIGIMSVLLLEISIHQHDKNYFHKLLEIFSCENFHPILGKFISGHGDSGAYTPSFPNNFHFQDMGTTRPQQFIPNIGEI